MPRKPETPGTCAYCGEIVTKRGVDKHLATCQKRQAALQTSNQPSETLWRLRVEGAYNKNYWLELEMRGSASLDQLDRYLRAIWLECCDHLSEFTLGGRYGAEVDMRRSANDVFQPALALRHRYDFGTTSETGIKVLRGFPGTPLTKYPISLLARNQMPEETCQECDQKAAWLCMECVYEIGKDVFLCDDHLENHEHEEGPIKLVNSPRQGMCGYSGPAKPPY
jgi:hypothetical protein